MSEGRLFIEVRDASIRCSPSPSDCSTFPNSLADISHNSAKGVDRIFALSRTAHIFVNICACFLRVRHLIAAQGPA